MKLSSLHKLSKSSSLHSQQAQNIKIKAIQQFSYTTPDKNNSFQSIVKTKSRSSENKLFLTQLKHPFNSQSSSQSIFDKANKSNSTPIKQILNSQKALPQSPFSKNCFASKSCRTLLTINQLKKNHHQQTSSTKHLTRSLQMNHQTSPKHPLLSSRLPSTILDPTRSIQPTHYTSVKLFMSSKFKKGKKQKLPINILAYPSTIHEKQTTDSIMSNSCVRNLNFEETVVVKQMVPNHMWNFSHPI